MPSEYLSRTLSLSLSHSLRRRKRLITQIATAAAAFASRILVAADAAADDGNADRGNFCDAFGGDILQLARSLEQIAFLPSTPLFLQSEDPSERARLQDDLNSERGTRADQLYRERSAVLVTIGCSDSFFLRKRNSS